MDVRYQREMTHNYMIIHAEEPTWSENYSCHMLEENSIPGILAFQTRHTGQGVDFYYEITSKQPLSHLFETKKPGGESIRRIIAQILDSLWVLEEYLLVEDGILLEPEYVYADPDSMELSLCFVPGTCLDFREKMKEFLRWIMERADHHDSKAVMLSYDLYETSLRDNYSAEDLRRCLDGSRSRIFCEKEGNLCPEADGNFGEPDSFCAGCGRNGTASQNTYPRDRLFEQEENGTVADREENGDFSEKKPGLIGIPPRAALRTGSVPAAFLSVGFAGELVIWFLTGFHGIGFYAGIFWAVLLTVLLVFRLTREHLNAEDEKMTSEGETETIREIYDGEEENVEGGFQD